MPIDWDDLKFVLAVSRARSFQGAARLLRVTHTTVSRRLAALEAQLATPLFLRENNLCVPTSVCVRLVAAAERIDEEVRSAERSASGDDEKPSGPVHITSVHWMISHVLLPAVPELFAEYPGIRLRFYGGLYDGPKEGPGSAIALRFELKPARGDEVIPVGNFGYAIYAPIDCEDVDSLPWISFGGSLPYSWLESQGVSSQDVLVTVGDATAVLAGVRSGVGRGLMPECIGDHDPGVRRLSGPKPEFVRTLRAVGEWSELSTLRTQSTIRWIEQTFEAIGCGFQKTEQQRA
jgi:DNA-binding transcriptional LysR family regulator